MWVDRLPNAFEYYEEAKANWPFMPFSERCAVVVAVPFLFFVLLLRWIVGLIFAAGAVLLLLGLWYFVPALMIVATVLLAISLTLRGGGEEPKE